ncbi:MAG: sigma-70 family RNA polymerase sigma factor [Actinomycetia bacterium]|nr:sigma-70 family RNA polymerase sigma factor [Actinomycetes bacterium]
MIQQNDRHITRLVTKAQSGGDDAFARLYELYFPQIYYYTLTRLKDEQLAQDTVQDIFLHALVKLNDLRDPRNFHAWLYRIATNDIYATFNRRTREHQQIQELPDHELAEDAWAPAADHTEEFLPESVLTIRERREEVLEQIGHLTDAQREVVLLYYFADLSLPQISGILNLSENAITKRLFDARQALRALLPTDEQSAPTAPVTRKTVIARLMAEDLHGADMGGAQAAVSASLAAVLPPMLAAKAFDPNVAGRVDAFARELAKHKAAAPAAATPAATKILIGAAVLALLVGAGAWALTRPGQPSPAHTPPAAVQPDAPKSIEATPAPEAEVGSAGQESQAEQQTPSQPAPEPAPSPAPMPAPAPALLRPTITVASAAVSYPAGTTLTPAMILADTQASARDSAGATLPVRVSGIAAIDVNQAGTWKVFLHAQDSKGTQATPVVVNVHIRA